jgi:hypothetical protein
MTLPELAAQRGWKRGEMRRSVRPLLREGVVLRRLVPLGPVSTKRRVVYQEWSALQGSLEL